MKFVVGSVPMFPDDLTELAESRMLVQLLDRKGGLLEEVRLPL